MALAGVLGGLLSAGVGLAGVGVQSQANADARNLGYLNYYLQRRIANENLRLQKSSRSDAEGNTVRYIPGQGFVTELNPTREAVVKGNLANELANVQEERKRRRERERNARRRDLFDETAREDLAFARFGPQKSEKAYQAMVSALLQREQDKGIRQFTDAAGIQARRAGDEKALQTIIEQGSKARGDALSQTHAQGLVQGTQLFNDQENRRGQLLAKAIQSNATASNIDDTPLGVTDVTTRLGTQQNRQFADLSNALARSAQSQGNALNSLAQLTQSGGSRLSSAIGRVGSGLSAAFRGIGNRNSSDDNSKLALRILLAGKNPNLTDALIQNSQDVLQRQLGGQGAFA